MKNAAPRIIVPFLLSPRPHQSMQEFAQEGVTLNLRSLALRYSETLLSGRIDDWTRLDLGCFSRLRGVAAVSSEARSQIAHTCYEDTVSISCRSARGSVPQPIDCAM